MDRLEEIHPAHYAHSLRVGLLVADYLGENPLAFTDLDKNAMIIAAIGHDIGKREILPDSLNDPNTQMEVIRTHSEAGRKIWTEAEFPLAAASAEGHHFYYPRTPGHDSRQQTQPERRHPDSSLSRFVTLVRAADQVDAMRIRNRMPLSSVREILSSDLKKIESGYFDDMLIRVG